MEFVSLSFLLFLPIVFALYWSVASHVKAQNVIIIAASYLFYGWVDWRFVLLLFGSSALSYYGALFMEKCSGQLTLRKAIFWLTLCVNIGTLVAFKYFDFFGYGLQRFCAFFGMSPDWPTLNLVLPVGISFYTFQALSYTIDVYRRQLQPTHNLLSFLAFISFFPQLVAGPIERAQRMLPQFNGKRVFSYDSGVDGMKRILWGLFKKMVIADNCAVVADYIFLHEDSMNSFTLAVGALVFAFQIYSDFSGYSDIAVGCGRLLGIQLMENFKLPYLSSNLKEFWRRWHISLNEWLRDYIYIPLHGSRRGLWRTCINVMTVFLVSGIWHGARFSYIIWGIAHGMLLVVTIIVGRFSRVLMPAQAHSVPNVVHQLIKVGRVLLTFVIVALLWIVFRCESVSIVCDYFSNLFSFRGGWTIEYAYATPVLWYIALLIVIELATRNRRYALDLPSVGLLRYGPVRWATFWIVAMGTFVLAGDSEPFIYFQF
jgi:D-alanyl-lipoteichoic acid acyltransferase DltB (MBOAT superfamily)